jgi:threonine dehydratase
VFEGKVPVAGKRVGIVISGGNIDPVRYGELLAGAPV